MKHFPISACSCMTLTSKSGKNYWFRTCDIDTDIWKEGAHIVSFPAGEKITFHGREKEECYYAFMGMTNDEKDTWLLDGVNSEGLTGGLLLLLEGTSVEKSGESGGGHEEYAGYVGMELVTKFLSACASVKEVAELAKKVQVRSVPYQGMFVPSTMHFFFADASGDEVILEATDKAHPGIFTIYPKKEGIGIMTNSPTYPEQIDNLAWYIAISPELKYGGEIEAEKKASQSLNFGNREVKGDAGAEHFLRSNTFPASYCSYDRFVRLAVLKSLNDCGRNFTDDKMLSYGSGIMSTVFEPRSKGIFHYTGFDEQDRPMNQKDGCTQYLVMYDTVQKKMYLRALDEAAFTEYLLDNCDKKKMTRYQVKHEGMAGIIKGN